MFWEKLFYELFSEPKKRENPRGGGRLRHSHICKSERDYK